MNRHHNNRPAILSISAAQLAQRSHAVVLPAPLRGLRGRPGGRAAAGARPTRFQDSPGRSVCSQRLAGRCTAAAHWSSQARACADRRRCPASACPASARTDPAPLCAQMSRSGVATMGVAKPMNAMPFLTAAKCQSSGLAGAEAGFDPLYFSDFLDVKWLREAELKHGRICMLCAPAAPRRRRAPARSPHAPPPLRRCRLAHFGAPRPQCVDGVHRAGVRVAPELPGVRGQSGRGLLLRSPGGPGAGAYPPRADRRPLRCAPPRPALRSARASLTRRSAAQILVFVSLIEIWSNWGAYSMNTMFADKSRKPGDLGFDPLKFGENKETRERLEMAELRNGRRARTRPHRPMWRGLRHAATAVRSSPSLCEPTSRTAGWRCSPSRACSTRPSSLASR